MDVWKPFMVIKNRETFDVELTEKIGDKEIKRTVRIKNGHIFERPKDVKILGYNTPDGFVIEGLEILKRRDQESFNRKIRFLR